jgi:thiol-disulfide isomerase/thioredoxin
MDRLQTLRGFLLFLLVAGLAACPAAEKAPAPNTRYQAVKATPTAKAPPEAWCDLEFAAGTGARLALPPATPVRKPGGALPTGRWVWLNLWAAWCKPCLREMPILLRWRDRLKQDGVALDLWFLSLDEDADELAKFLAAHPEAAPAPSLRVSSLGEFKRWAEAFLFDADAPIPLHLLAAPDGRVRCIHNGSINEGDYATLAAWLR